MRRVIGLCHAGRKLTRSDVGCSDCPLAALDLPRPTERARAWTLGGVLGGTEVEPLRREVARLPFVTQTGHVEVGMPGLMITAQR